MAKQKSSWKSNSQVINIRTVFLNVLKYIAYGRYTIVILLYFRKNLIIIWTTCTQVMQYLIIFFFFPQINYLIKCWIYITQFILYILKGYENIWILLNIVSHWARYILQTYMLTFILPAFKKDFGHVLFVLHLIE